MEMSLRKTISNGELENIFNSFSLSEDERVNLKTELFDNPSASYLLLKEDIRNLEDLEKKLKSINNNLNLIETIKKAFIIDEDLQIPSDLRKDLLSSLKFGLFIGAGVSKLLGIPLWEELSLQAIDYLVEKGDINFGEADRLKNEKLTPRQILSIFHIKIKNKYEIEKFYKDRLSGRSNNYGNPYELLYEFEKILIKPLLKITTNLDLEWEKVLKKKIEEKNRDISRNGRIIKDFPIFYTQIQNSNFTRNQEIKETILYQIHGNINNLDNAVITTSDYVKKYRDEDGLKGFLENVFKNYTIIFIGSGIQEFEILEHCLKISGRKHYALVGTYWEEKNLFRIKNEYFSSLNIVTIPYFLDFQRYNRLFFVLQEWIKQIESSRKAEYYRNIKLLDEV